MSTYIIDGQGKGPISDIAPNTLKKIGGGSNSNAQESINRVLSVTYSDLGITPDSTLEEKQTAISIALEGYENPGTDNLFFEIKNDESIVNIQKTEEYQNYSTLEMQVQGAPFTGSIKLTDLVFDPEFEPSELKVIINGQEISDVNQEIALENIPIGIHKLSIYLIYDRVIPPQENLEEIVFPLYDEPSFAKCLAYGYTCNVTIYDIKGNEIASFPSYFNYGDYCNGTLYILSESENGTIDLYEPKTMTQVTLTNISNQYFNTWPNYLILGVSPTDYSTITQQGLRTYKETY